MRPPQVEVDVAGLGVAEGAPIALEHRCRRYEAFWFRRRIATAARAGFEVKARVSSTLQDGIITATNTNIVAINRIFNGALGNGRRTGLF